MIKVYDYKSKNEVERNFELWINFDDLDNGKDMTDVFRLIVSRVEVDYENHSLRIGVSLRCIAYAVESLRAMEQEIQNALRLLDENKHREMTAVEYSGYGIPLKSEIFNCYVEYPSGKHWTYSWHDSAKEDLMLNS